MIFNDFVAKNKFADGQFVLNNEIARERHLVNITLKLQKLIDQILPSVFCFIFK